MPDHKLRRELAACREDPTVATARAQAGGVFTVAELAVGGCLSALSSIRCGFKHVHLWTTETDAHKAELVELLTRAPYIGGTFAHNYGMAMSLGYYKAGQPCTDYSSPGPHTGRGKDSRTSWMYTAQGQ